MEEQPASNHPNGLNPEVFPRPIPVPDDGEGTPRVIDLSRNGNLGNSTQGTVEIHVNRSPQSNRAPQVAAIRVRNIAEMQIEVHRQPPRVGYALPPNVYGELLRLPQIERSSQIENIEIAPEPLPAPAPEIRYPAHLPSVIRDLVFPPNHGDEEMDVDEERNEPEGNPPAQEPTPSASALNLDDTDDGEAGSLCAICYSPYTNSGEHRLSCLKCGHLFGESCIKHWLKNGCQSSNKRCPSCNSKASLRDIRLIYARNLVALDTSEKDRLNEKLEKVISEKNTIESHLNQSNLRNQLLTEKLREYEDKIRELTENNNRKEQNVVAQRRSIFTSKMLSSFHLCSEGGCRVLAYNNQLSLLLASQASTNPLFPGYGVRKFNMQDMKPTTYQNIHKKSIRDMCFSQHDRCLLSVSLDCTAKIYDTQSNAVVSTFQAPVPLWSCTWSSVNANKFYCGSQNGTWFMFDKRHLRPDPEQIVETCDPKDKSGIISLCHIPPRAGRFMPSGGIIACRLNNIVAHYESGDSMASKVLPIEGAFMSMAYNQNTDHLLISTKASTKWNTSRHMICQLSEMKNGEAECEGVDILQTFYGSRITNVLSKSTFVPFPNGDLTVGAYNARNSNLDLWSVISEAKLEINDVTLNEPILDICSFQTNEDDIIIPCLSDKKLSVIKLNFDKK